MLGLGVGNKQKRKVSYDVDFYMTPSSAPTDRQTRLRYGLCAILAFLVVMSITSMNSSLPTRSFRSGLTPSPPPIQWERVPDRFEIGFVADLDKGSKVKDSKKPKFVSYFQKAVLTRKSAGDADTYAIEWKDMATFSTTLNEAGRGFELSELAWFQGHLHSFDDRTGIVFRLDHFQLNDPIDSMRALPAYIAMEGNGDTDKGQKHEWATVKDGELVMGSIGKEFTSNSQIIHENNMWVSILARNGNVRHEDWTDRFKKVREYLGCGFPGYVVHEAIEWSAVHRKWFILPRRVSVEPYDDMADEKRGSNVMVLASEDFSELEVRKVGAVVPERGFSSFKFVPGTQDSVIVALKSMEDEELQAQAAFVTVFSIDGAILMPETPLPGAYKYEGVAFLHDY